MGARSVLLGLSLPLALTLFTLAGCTSEADELLLDPAPFADGVARDTEGGAFRVALHGDALRVGANSLVVRVGFHDSADPLDPGRGIPEATIEVDAWMPEDGGTATATTRAHLGDGRYALPELNLDRPGVWRFDLRVRVGESLDEFAAFAFEVDGPEVEDPAPN